jgi:glycosyltransferase involved in cell wall biosynthesis
MKSIKNIVMDMSPLIHGSRAVRRCVASLASELIKNNNINYHHLYFDYKRQHEKHLKTGSCIVNKKVIPIPYRILIPLWKKFSWPKLETIIPDCDILYTNNFYFPPTKKRMILATIHGLAYRIIPDRIPSKIVKALENGLLFVLEHADYLIAVSETTKEELIDQVGVADDRIYVVSHGVDKQFRKKKDFKAVLRRLKVKFDLHRPYILYVGAIGVHKNIMGILAAYKQLFQNTDNDLVLAGPQDSAWIAAKRFICENNMSDRVHLLGHVHNTDQLVDLYNGANLFVFPSFYEGWTSPPLEAMACGTPVITSNCSSLPETVGEAAIKIDPSDTEELTLQIEKILGDKLLQNSLIKRGLVHVKSHTWEKAANKMVKVYEEIKTRGPWKYRRL